MGPCLDTVKPALSNNLKWLVTKVMTSLLMPSNMDVRRHQRATIEFIRHEGIKQVEIVETL